MRDIVLCNPVRTAIGGYGGSLKGVAATELGATAVRETLPIVTLPSLPPSRPGTA
jgi:acetyl-CoA C-acetyltransferase